MFIGRTLPFYIIEYRQLNIILQWLQCNLNITNPVAMVTQRCFGFCSVMF